MDIKETVKKFSDTVAKVGAKSDVKPKNDSTHSRFVWSDGDVEIQYDVEGRSRDFSAVLKKFDKAKKGE